MLVRTGDFEKLTASAIREEGALGGPGVQPSRGEVASSARYGLSLYAARLARLVEVVMLPYGIPLMPHCDPCLAPKDGVAWRRQLSEKASARIPVDGQRRRTGRGARDFNGDAALGRLGDRDHHIEHMEREVAACTLRNTRADAACEVKDTHTAPVRGPGFRDDLRPSSASVDSGRTDELIWVRQLERTVPTAHFDLRPLDIGLEADHKHGGPTTFELQESAVLSRDVHREVRACFGS